jgi:hypothetical protein
MDAKITSVEAELVELKSLLLTTTGDERIAIRGQITAKENQLTELYKHMPITGSKHSAFKI